MPIMDSWELHPDRLATTDENGRRIFLQPADVKGRFRTRRNRTQAVLILIFLALPWIQVNGKQWLLLNVAQRKFEIFGLSLRAHNTPLLFLCLATAGFGLFFVTAVWGRAWCGWACPQTVFIDGVFRRIERWIEGPALERRRLQSEPWSIRKLTLRTVKWSLFSLAALGITHSFLAYFVGGPELIDMVTSSPLTNWSSFLFILISTAIILFDFAWFREQFCIIACPYGRFQSVLMDSHSRVVAYDAKRGEPRRTPEHKALGTPLGDCVNCYRCVQVCPTGIDIRRGTQMECIACTACIDACNDVMIKMKKPTGLIRYETERGLQGKKVVHLRGRVLIYGGACLLAALTLAFLLISHQPLDVQFLRAKGAPYDVVRANGRADVIVNRFQIELSNQSEQPLRLDFLISQEMKEKGVEIIVPLKPVSIEAGVLRRVDLFVRFPTTLLQNGQARLAVTTTSQSLKPQIKEIPLVGPIH